MWVHRHITEHLFWMHTLPVVMLIVDGVWAKVTTQLFFAGVVYDMIESLVRNQILSVCLALHHL